MWNDVYQLTVLFGALALLMILVVQGKSIFVVAPLSALVAAVLSGMDPVERMNVAYMNGFSDYIRRFYLLFALGAVFGRMMEQSGAAITIASTVGRGLGKDRACLAVVLSCALLTYGGVSLFVVGFSVYPLAIQLFQAADLPRRFIPAAIAFGSITFTMTSAGSPEIQNLIPITYLVDKVTQQPLTDARAGWQVSILVGGVMFGLGQLYLNRAIRRAKELGEAFDARRPDASPTEGTTNSQVARPGFLRAIAPLLATLLTLNFLSESLHRVAEFEFMERWPTVRTAMERYRDEGTIAIFVGVIVALVLFRPWLSSVWPCFGEGFMNGLLAVGSTSAVVGFGFAMKDLPAFQRVVSWVTHLPGDPLINAAIAMAVIAAIAGSASGGQGIALPIIKPIFIDELGVGARALHRIIAISSGTLDSLPANGYLVMLIRNICGETHARAYLPIFVTTVLIPAAGTVLAITLFKLFPQWG